MAVDGYLNFDTKINTGGFKNGVKSINSALDGIRSSLKGVASAVGVAFGIKEITAFSKSAKEAWNVQLEAETKLETVLGRNLGATKEQIQAVKDWASELQNVGVIGDEVQLSGLQELSTYIENADSLRKMNVVLNDMLAQQYGLNATAESAVTISTMLGKVLEGQTSALSRYGYSFTEAQEQLLKYGTEEQKVATLADVVEASVGGMNEALARTPAGRLKQVENTLGDIKEQFGKAVTNLQTVFLPLLENAVSLLEKGAEKAVRFSESLAKVFGVELNSSAAVGSDISSSVVSQNELTDAVAETGEALEENAEIQKNSLAGFDKMNILSSGSENTSNPETVEKVSIEPVTDKTAVEETAEEVSDSLADKIKKVFEPIKIAWETDDSGLRILNAISEICEKIHGFFGRIIQDTKEWWSELNLSPLFSATAEFLETLEPLIDTVFDALAWAYENVLLPLGKWTIEKAVPAAIKLFSSALRVLTAVINLLKPVAKWLWENFLKPIAKWTGGMILGILGYLTDKLNTLADFLSGKISFKDFIGSFSDLEIIIGSVAAAIGLLLGANAIAGLIVKVIALTSALIANAAAWVAANLPIIAVTAAIAAVIAIGVLLIKHWDEVKAAAEYAWESIKLSFVGTWEGIKYAWGGAKQWFSDLWESIKKTFSNVGTFFRNIFTKAWNGIKTAFGSVRQFFSDVWTGIKNVFSHVTNWFRDTFSKAWQAVKDVFSAGGEIFTGITDGILNAFRTVVNGLIDGINNIIIIPFNALNDVLNGIRNAEIAGITPFSWLPYIEIPQIPHLAQGTVVPANYGEFLAVLGDNKRETEIVSPLGTIEQAVTNAMRKNAGNSTIHVHVKLDGREIGRVAVKAVDENNSRKG